MSKNYPKLLTCFVCGIQLDGVDTDRSRISEGQPYSGTTFFSHGQYGSTVFDDMLGNYIALTICDKCLIEKNDEIVFYRKKTVQKNLEKSFEVEDWNLSAEEKDYVMDGFYDHTLHYKNHFTITLMNGMSVYLYSIQENTVSLIIDGVKKTFTKNEIFGNTKGKFLVKDFGYMQVDKDNFYVFLEFIKNSIQ